MAMVCCEYHGASNGITHQYLACAKPVGYPNAAVLCCQGSCRRPGLAWLNEQGKVDYDSGQKEIVI
ncbi:hypothetical protein ACFLWS_04415 [Chloroflexota bacterium]